MAMASKMKANYWGGNTDMSKIQYQGREVEATPVEIIRQEERSNEYQLADGTLLKARLVVMDISKLEGEIDANGNQVYLVNSQTITSARSP